MKSFPEKVSVYKSELIEKPKTGNPNRHHLELYDEDILVAFLSFSYDDKHIWGREIKIESVYRRNGIATEIYNTLEVWSGKPIKFQKTALASDEMRLFVEKYLKTGTVHSNDGNIVVFSTDFSMK
ncbi:MAG: hypothetical protein Mars2KO_41510 [Maribacter sp.]